MFIGIDIGGTTIKGGLIDNKGSIIHKKTLPTLQWRVPMEIIKDVAKIINILSDKADGDIQVVGVGVPGVISQTNDFIEKCANINLEKVPLKEKLEDLTNQTIFVDNDANVAAIAEYEVGALKKYNSGILLTLGTGIGGGIIVKDQVIRGFHGAGAEVGHMVVGNNFYTCNCGRNGCLETFSSATGINKYAKKLLNESNDKSNLRSYDSLSAKIVFDEAKNGDKLALKVVDRMSHYLAIGIVNLINLLDPQGIAIGGGVSHAGDFLIKKINKHIEQQLYSDHLDIAEIILAKLGNDAGIIGAGYMAKNIIKK